MNFKSSGVVVKMIFIYNLSNSVVFVGKSYN